MKRLTLLAPLALLIVACSGSGMSGKYLIPGYQTYGFEFEGDTVYSLGGNDIARGTYTVEGSTVRICMAVLCTDLRLVGDCLIQNDGGRYCKEETP